MKRAISMVAGFALATSTLVCSLQASAAPATPVKAGEWVTHGRDDSEQRYSPLKQITADNARQLGLAWYADLTERGQWQTTPIMVDGRLYVTTPWSKVYAFEAASGKFLWKYDPKVPREIAATSLCCNNSNRGVAYSQGKLIWGTLDGRLIAIDAKKGTKVWETLTIPEGEPMSITGAPRIGNGIVFIGQAGSEFHQRGFMSAYDVKTGKQLWKFFLTPGNPAKGPDGAASDSVMEMAAKTWKGEWWKTGGGATPWDGILYDPETDSVIFGTGNGAPWPAEVRSPGGGDNLFTASIVSLDAKTGKYKWHYQTVPMDNFDFDNTSPLTTADLTIDGQKKHVVMQIPKNGVFYVIEAATGKVLSAQLAVPQANWLTGFDKTKNWAPILNPDANFGKTGKGWFVVPFQTHVWYPQSYNPNTGLFYVGIRYATYGMVSEAGAKMGNQLLSINVAKRPEYAPPKLEGLGQWLTAWDPVTQKEVWRAKEGTAASGTMTTAGNLVFQGSGRNFIAYKADTGDKVWSAETGMPVSAGSITYEVGGTQYVAAVAGGPGSASTNRLLVYKLGGGVSLPPAPPAAPAQAFNPPTNFGSDAQLARGEQIYTQNCTICHEGGRGMGGFPDLRTTPMMQSTDVFKAIVYDGALTENGMNSFKKTLTPDDVEAVRAHIVRMANDYKSNPRAQGFGPGGGGGGRGPGAPAAGGPAPIEQPVQGLHQ
jgi:quinohemoprotein ethanol dehydrogenase